MGKERSSILKTLVLVVCWVEAFLKKEEMELQKQCSIELQKKEASIELVACVIIKEGVKLFLINITVSGNKLTITLNKRTLKNIP